MLASARHTLPGHGSKVLLVAKAAFLIPGDLSTRTGGYAYDRRVLDLLPSCGVEVNHVPLPELYPEPSANALAETERLISIQDDDAALLFDGLAYGVMPTSSLQRCCDRTIALIHHPLFLEVGLERKHREMLFLKERAALAMARAIIVTSATTKGIVASEFGFPAQSIVVAEPGTDLVKRAMGTGNPVQLLSVGAVIPRKGYSILVEALAQLSALDWQLRIVGPLDRDPSCARDLLDAISLAGLSGRVELLGTISDYELSVAYEESDVFVMSSLFEGYGMVLAEAMAFGLPIVCTTGGACAETVPENAALKVAPGDYAALAMALKAIISDSKLRLNLAENSWWLGQSLPSWKDTAHLVAQAIVQVQNERL